MVESTDRYAEDPLLTSAEVAELARISRATLGRAVKRGDIIPLRTPGGHYRFRRADVDALLTGQKAS